MSERAILLEAKVHQVDNKVRRGIFHVAANLPSTDAEVSERSKRLAPGGSWQVYSHESNHGIVVKVTNPITCTLVKGTESMTFKINSLFMFTDEIDEIGFVNESAVDSTIRLVQA